MGLETRLLQKLSQRLVMTPQLELGIKLMSLGRLEYIEQIKEELLKNPVLEIQSGTDAVVNEPSDGEFNRPANKHEENDSIATPEDYKQASLVQPETSAETERDMGAEWSLSELDKSYYQRESATPRGLIDNENRPTVENIPAKGGNLTEHIIFQLRMNDVPAAQMEIALHIVGNLNRDGYLGCTYEELCEEAKCSLAQLEEVIDLFKELDPAGLAARNLSECLVWQLDAMGQRESLAGKIAEFHLDKIEKRRFDLIAKAENCSVEDVTKALTSIQRLDPRPGRQFSDDVADYILPDIYVIKVNNEFVVTQNEDGLPKLKINSYYLDMIQKLESAQAETTKTEELEYINERLKSARELIKSIYKRQETIYKVACSIVKYQREFFEHGITKLKPLVRAEVANDIGMHESTVSRATSNKYMHTPQGVYELKFFFTTGIKTGDSEISSSAVKDKIRLIIEAESQEDPVSDQKLVEMLKADGIDIARRTVAKYREVLRIPSSSKRKRLL